MKKWPWLALLSLVSSIFLFSPGVALGQSDEKNEAKMLEQRGKALRYSIKTTNPKSSIDTGGAAIFVNAPIASVRKIVTDYRHYDKFIKPFDQSRLLSRRKGVSEVYFEVPVMHGAAKIWAVVNIHPPEKDGDGEKIVAHYSRGNVDDFRAVWRLRAVDDSHTIVKLELLVDPQLPIPGSMVTPELQYAADKAVTAVRDRTEKPKAIASATSTSPGTQLDERRAAPSVAKR